MRLISTTASLVTNRAGTVVLLGAGLVLATSVSHAAIDTTGWETHCLGRYLIDLPARVEARAPPETIYNGNEVKTPYDDVDNLTIIARAAGEIPDQTGFCIAGGFIRDNGEQKGFERSGAVYATGPGPRRLKLKVHLSSQEVREDLLNNATVRLYQLLSKDSADPVVRSQKHNLSWIGGAESVIHHAERNPPYYELTWRTRPQSGSDIPALTLMLGAGADFPRSEILELWDTVVDSLRPCKACNAQPVHYELPPENQPNMPWSGYSLHILDEAQLEADTRSVLAPIWRLNETSKSEFKIAINRLAPAQRSQIAQASDKDLADMLLSSGPAPQLTRQQRGIFIAALERYQTVYNNAYAKLKDYGSEKNSSYCTTAESRRGQIGRWRTQLSEIPLETQKQRVAGAIRAYKITTKILFPVAALSGLDRVCWQANRTP